MEQLALAEQALGVNFNDRSTLASAFTHQSYLNEHPENSITSNERLEFLGDSIIGMAVADRMFLEAPALPEGELTVRRSRVIRRETLAMVATSIGLGKWLVMGRGEEAAGGSERPSNLADVFEAVVGAIYVDQGYTATRDFINRYLGRHVDLALVTENPKDPKSRLQEFLQAHGKKPPHYELQSQSGSESNISFTMKVVIDVSTFAFGEGSRKVDAERAAASKALAMLKSIEKPGD